MNRGRERFLPSPPSEPGVRFSRDGLSSQLFPHRDWRANLWISYIVNNPRSAKKVFDHCLCHFPPLTPVCRAANIASVQSGAGTNFRCMQLPSALASRLVVSDTGDASTFISALSGLWLSTFLPHFPDAPFALTHFSTVQPISPCPVLLGL